MGRSPISGAATRTTVNGRAASRSSLRRKNAKKKEKKPKPQRQKNNDKAIARLEREIQRMEDKSAQLDKLSEEYATDYQKLMEIAAQKEELEAQLLELYEKWEEMEQ